MGMSVKVPVGTAATAGAAAGVNAGAAGAAAGVWWYENMWHNLTVQFLFTVPNTAQPVFLCTYRTGFRWNETVNIFPGDSPIGSSTYGRIKYKITHKQHKYLNKKPNPLT